MTAVRLTKNYDAAQAGEVLRRGSQQERQMLRRELIEQKAVIDLEISALNKQIKALRLQGQILEKWMRDVKWRIHHPAKGTRR